MVTLRLDLDVANCNFWTASHGSKEKSIGYTYSLKALFDFFQPKPSVG